MKHTTLSPALTAYFAGRTVEPVGFLSGGRPVFPIAGGADDDPPKDPPAGDPPKDDPPKFEPISSQADLDRVLGERLARERAKFADYDDLKKIKAERDQALADAMTEQEKAVAAARKEGESAATEAANARMVQAEARALAAQAHFRSLSDVSLIDLSGVTVGEDGKVDGEAIKAKLKELSEAEPWRIDDGKKPAPKPDRSQGGGSGDEKPSVLAGRELYESRRGAKKTTAS